MNVIRLRPVFVPATILLSISVVLLFFLGGRNYSVEGRGQIEFWRDCFEVPAGWLVDSAPVVDGQRIYYLRENVATGPRFASVRRIKDEPILAQSTSRQVVQRDNFSAYEVLSFLPENPVRFWSYSSDTKMVVLGESLATVEYVTDRIVLEACR